MSIVSFVYRPAQHHNGARLLAAQKIHPDELITPGSVTAGEMRSAKILCGRSPNHPSGVRVKGSHHSVLCFGCGEGLDDIPCRTSPASPGRFPHRFRATGSGWSPCDIGTLARQEMADDARQGTQEGTRGRVGASAEEARGRVGASAEETRDSVGTSARQRQAEPSRTPCPLFVDGKASGTGNSVGGRENPGPAGEGHRMAREVGRGKGVGRGEGPCDPVEPAGRFVWGAQQAPSCGVSR